MSFFEHQARARRNTVWLVILFVLAVLGVTLAVNLVVVLLDRGIVGRFPFVVLDSNDRLTIASARLPLRVYALISLGTLIVIALRSLVALQRLRAGGDAVAALAGGTPVERGTGRIEERRLLNIVDEMAIASGVMVPRVWVLRGEDGINAFAAGYAPNEAAIAITEGALTRLTRDELQGVVAHEFSHVLNGDMRLNVQMIGVLAGILFVGEMGGALMRGAGRGSGRGRNASGVFVLGLILMAVGYIGLFFGRLIKAAVSRERELLGDASAAQFTRNPDGLASALATIAALPQGSLVRDRHAESLSHMFFAQGVDLWFQSLFATHPPIAERIRRLNPAFLAAGRRSRHIEDRSVVRAGTIVASVANPAPAHVAYASALLDGLPAVVRDALASPEGAAASVFALALDTDEAAQKEQLGLLQAAGLDALAQRSGRLAAHVRALPARQRLPVVSLALPALREHDDATRSRLVELLVRVVEADRHVTLAELALLTVVRHHLGPHAGRAEPVRFRSILEVVEPARRVLSLLAHAGTADTGRAAARGLAALQLAGDVAPLTELDFEHIAQALDQLRRLAPFVKKNLVAACVETITADGRITLAEAELLRAVAIALDCPIPPILDALDADPVS